MYKIKDSFKKGLGFGLTSGIITTLGMIVGLNSGTHSRVVVLSGILIIALADALSDSFGIHMSEESEGHHSDREVWESTFVTFISKLIFASSFIIPIILFPLNIAVILSVIWGLLLIILFSFFVARQRRKKSFRIIFEHVLITLIVIIATYYIGYQINKIFS